MDLGFFAADTLGVTLYQTKGKLQGGEVRQFKCGPWRFDLDVDVESDVLGAVELGFWVTLAKTIRLYAIIKEKENWIFVLDAAKLKACGAKTGFEALTVKGRMGEIKPAVQAVYRWRDAGWERVQYSGAN